jgi:hypothetical protein
MARMRFEVAAAWAMGIALPALETVRRGTSFDDIPGYVDDYLIGAFLLYAARAATRRRPNGAVLLVAAWGILCGGFYSSFFGQIRYAATPDVSGYPNTLVIAVKGCLYAVAIAALVRAIRAARVPA